MNAKLQVYVAKPVYSDQLKKQNKTKNTMTLVLGPDWQFTRLQETRPSSGDKNGWVPELDTRKRGRPTRRERMEAQAKQED